MTLEEALAAAPEAARPVIVAAIEDERQRGIMAKSEVNNEAKGLRTRLHALEAPLKEVFGEQIPEDWHTQIKGMKGSTEKLTEKEKLLAGMSEEQKAIMKKLAELEKTNGEIMTEREQLKKEKVTNALQDALRKSLGGKVYNEELTFKGLMLDGTVSYDEEKKSPVWRSGDKVLPFEEGVKSFLSTADVRVSQRPGPGAGSEGGKAGSSEAAGILAGALKMSGRSSAS